MIFKGHVYVFGDDLNTDVITPGRFFFENYSIKELAEHMMEDIRPNFYNEIVPGNFIVGGKNFGCGSSRESAPAVIKEAGIPLVIAKSFSRIFYRTSISIGLIPVECDTSGIQEGDYLEVDLERGEIKTPNEILKFKPMAPSVLQILLNGGMRANFEKNNYVFKL